MWSDVARWRPLILIVCCELRWRSAMFNEMASILVNLLVPCMCISSCKYLPSGLCTVYVGLNHDTSNGASGGSGGSGGRGSSGAGGANESN